MQKNEINTRKERQEILAFYLRPDAQAAINQHIGALSLFYDKLVGALDSSQRELMRLRLSGYAFQFGEASGLVPKVLTD